MRIRYGKLECPEGFGEKIMDYVGGDNPVRLIDSFVERLDMAGCGFERSVSNRKGRPSYDPWDLLKLYLYGYMNRARSSRWIEITFS